MAIYYIDPANGTGTGVGTELDPFADYDEVTWAYGDIVYQKAGTTAVQPINVDVDNVTVGSYITGTNNSYAGLDKPKLVVAPGNNRAVSNNVTTTYSVGLIIKDLDISGGDTRCVLFTHTTKSTNINCRLLNCDVHDPIGIGVHPCVRVIASNCLVKDCTIYNSPDDGIYIEGNNTEVDNCVIHTCDDEGNGTGDYIQAGGAEDCNAVYIHDCSLGNGVGQTRHGLIVNPTSVTGTGGHIIRDNTIIGGKTVLSIKDYSDNSIIERNIIKAVDSTDTSYLVYIQCNNNIILNDVSFINNIVDGRNVSLLSEGIYIHGATAATEEIRDTLIANNIFINIDSGSVETLKSSFAGSLGTQVINNIFLNCTSNNTVRVRASAYTEDSNNYFNNTGINNLVNESNAALTPTNPVLLDPLLDINYIPLNQSSIINSGNKYWGNGPRPTDYIGVAVPDININIGVYQ